MNKIIEIEDLTVSFGNFDAGLKNVTCSISADPGIIGLIGPNGAGKTTLIHAIADNIKRVRVKLSLLIKLWPIVRTHLNFLPTLPQQRYYNKVAP